MLSYDEILSVAGIRIPFVPSIITPVTEGRLRTGRYEMAENRALRRVLVSFVDGSSFARVFLSEADRSGFRSFVRPLSAVRLTAGLDEVRVLGPNQTSEP